MPVASGAQIATGYQSSISEPRSGKSANIMTRVAHAADILRRLQDFLPGLACATDGRRAELFRPVYFRCPFERAAVFAPLVRTVEVTPSGAVE
jgi:hypothetical protein